MLTSVADAIAALKRGDASSLEHVLNQRKEAQRHKPLTNKRKTKSKSKKSETETDTEVLDKDKGFNKTHVEDQVRALSRTQLNDYYPTSMQLVAPSDDTEEEGRRLKARECIAEFTALLIETKGASIDKEEIFAVAQELHDQLLRLRGESDQVLATQEAISLLCEACWKHNFCGRAHSLVTQLLPYLIVRSYESPATDRFNSKKHPIRRLFAIKDALPLLDFDDDSSGLLRDILLRCFIQSAFFKSPDAVPFLSFLFTLHVPFVEDINETIRNQIPNQRNSILIKYGLIYFKAWVGSKRAFRAKIEEECIQRYVRDAVHAGSTSLFNAVRTVLQVFFDNKRHPDVDEMLYRICSPILWRGVKAPNDSVRRQATILLFDNFPLRDPAFNNEMMDLTLQKQFDTFEELLGDSHPALRVAAIEGVSKVLSVYWELLPAETIRCFISKLVVDLVNDASSSTVRAAVFQGVQFILDNHNSHSILKPLLPMLAPLINDRNEKVRAEFGALLVRIKSIRNLHFYDVVPVNDLLCRMVMDRGSPLACKQLVSLFLNSYFPQSVGGSSQVARCLALVRKNPEAAMVFYANVAEHVSAGSVCKLAALLLRCSLNFVSRRLKQPQESEDEDDEDDDNEEESFSVVGQVVVLEIIGNLLKSVRVKIMGDDRYSECKGFLREQLNIESLEALLLAYSEDRTYNPEALSSIWRIIGYLGNLSGGVLLKRLVENLMKMNEASNRKLLESMVDCMVQWEQLPFLVSKLVKVLKQWRKTKLCSDTAGLNPKKSKVALNPVVALGTIEYIVQLPTVKSLYTLVQPIVEELEQCIDPFLELGADKIVEVYKAHSLSFVRLVEVYAKVLVMAECARVNDETSLLAVKSSKRLKKDDLRDLQPSEVFTPPKSLSSLFVWLARLMLDLRKEVEQTTAHGKKRRRGKNIAQDQLSPQKELCSRWRNLFSLVSLLSAECVAFALERTHRLQNGPVADFVDAYVDTLCETLRDMKFFERTAFYHAGQLVHLLVGARVKAVKSTRAQVADLVPSLEHWASTLQQTLESVHEKERDKCDDLWPVVSASFGVQCDVEPPACSQTVA
ncbi:unnamed protein product [Peronospora farinosa]|uniref:Condensin complex subunit 1 C-terminal domain-containing protein n=1 Tax=Peronospora farinosa TaxID=134698 RepID=A0AAV0SUY4_9STRA|nr:unnamed protein product [Peronospora farinosa]CAI5706749.1 unnamed protein product [Peronospora farinosa]